VHVGQLVFDRLVAADRAAELVALFGVLHRLIEHRLRRADELRGRRQHPELEGAVDVRLTRRT
jgi:hypothetical protein